MKGPVAALYGRGEPGGTVNIVSKHEEIGTLKGSASALFGSFDRIRFDADANIPIGENVAVRLVGFSEKADSVRDTVNSNRFGLLPSVAVRLAFGLYIQDQISLSDTVLIRLGLRYDDFSLSIQNRAPVCNAQGPKLAEVRQDGMTSFAKTKLV